MSKYEGERVLVIRKTIIPKTLSQLRKLPYEFIDRDEAEQVGCAYLQVIPYIVVQSSDDSVFCYTRLSGGSEKRLADKSSIGIGGHINPIDQFMSGGLGITAIIANGALRECAEELDIDLEAVPNLGLGLGSSWPHDITNHLIYDDSNEVGKVHIGVPMHLRCDQVEIREKGKLEGKFISIDEFTDMENLETWSDIIRRRMGSR